MWELLLCTSKQTQSPYVIECVINLTNQNNSSFLGGVALIEMDRAGLGVGRGWFPSVTGSKLSSIFL